MDTNENASLGDKSLAVFTFVLVTLSSTVAIMVSFLSTDSTYKMSYLIVYIWVIILSITSILAMLAFCALKRTELNFEEDGTTFSRYYVIATIIVGIGASIFHWFEIVRVGSCITMNSFLDTKFSSAFFLGVLSLAELGFLIRSRSGKYNCRNRKSRMFLSVVISANVFILINGVLDVFRAANTEPDTALNYIKYDNDSQTSRDYFRHTLVFSHCDDGIEVVDHFAGTFYKYFFTFSLEFCFMSLCVLVPMWNITGRTVERRESVNDGGSNTLELMALDPSGVANGNSLKAKLKKIAKGSLTFASNHPWKLSLTFVFIIFAFHLIIEFVAVGEQSIQGNSTLTGFETANYYVQTIYTYIICSVPFLGYFVVKRYNPLRLHFNVKHILLCIAAIGHLLLVLLETLDSIAVLANTHSHVPEKAAYLLKILFHYLGTYCQTVLILKAFEIFNNRQIHESVLRLRCIKGVIIFLGVCNTERWIVNSFITAQPLKYIQDFQGDDTFGHRNWWLLTHLIFPFVVFYRMISAILCFELIPQIPIEQGYEQI